MPIPTTRPADAVPPAHPPVRVACADVIRVRLRTDGPVTTALAA